MESKDWENGPILETYLPTGLKPEGGRTWIMFRKTFGAQSWQIGGPVVVRYHVSTPDSAPTAWVQESARGWPAYPSRKSLNIRLRPIVN